MFRSISPSLRRLTALGAVALLGLAACGSDDAEPAASAPAATEAPAVIEQKETPRKRYAAPSAPRVLRCMQPAVKS